MWITCYNCYGSGYEIIKKDNNYLSEKENTEKTCRVCERYRTSNENYQFYGQIWVEDDYNILTPPSSPS